MSVKSDNYIVISKSLIPAKKFEVAMIRGLNRNIIDLMENLGYFCVEAQPRDLIFGEKFFLALTFYSSYEHQRVRLSSRVKKGLRLLNNSDINGEKFRKYLRSMREEYPFKVGLTIEPMAKGDNFAGYIVKIETEPAILARKANLSIEKWVEPSKYQEIIGHNVRFHRSIVAGIAGRIVEEPSPQRPRGSERPPIIEWAQVERMPRDVEICLREANLCFEHECYIACSIMMRKAIEVAVTKRFLQTGNADKLLDKEKNELSLAKKLARLVDFMSSIRREAEDLKVAKWFGDRGAHDPTVTIPPETLQTVIAPRVMVFLSKLELKS